MASLHCHHPLNSHQAVTPPGPWHQIFSQCAGRHKERVETPSATAVDDWGLFSYEPPGLRVCRVPSDWSVPFDDAKIVEKELAGAEPCDDAVMGL